MSDESFDDDIPYDEYMEPEDENEADFDEDYEGYPDDEFDDYEDGGTDTW